MKNKLAELGRTFVALFQRGQFHADLAEEIRLHQELREQEQVENGISPKDAHYAALRRFGNELALREESRDMWGWNWLETLLQDVHFGLRQLRRNPGFTTVAVLTLALGIGANTAIFSMVRGILLRALPYPQPQRLYAVREDIVWHGQVYSSSLTNGGNFTTWRRNCHSFAGIAALEPVNSNLDLRNRAVQIHGTRASANLFSILGTGPMLGRAFTPQEDLPGRNREVILTYPLWRAEFNSDPEILGKTIRLDGYRYTVVGVLPSSFYFPKFDQLDGGAVAGWTSAIQYFVPLALEGSWETTPAIGDNMNFTVIARLNPGISRQQALADLDSVEAEISRRDPHADGAFLRGQLLPLKTAIVSATNKTLWMLMAGAGLVLLIVCVNLASLLLTRSMSRTHEVAVRAALGANRWNLLRQFLTEGLLLVIAGGAIGILLAREGLHAIVRRAPVSIPRLDSIHVDSRVLLFSLTVSIGAGLLFSVLPGLRLSGTQPADALKSAASTITGARATARLRDVLAGAQVALCTVLLVAALLLVASLTRVLNENSWLEAQHALAVDLIAPSNEYGTQPKLKQLYETLLQRVKALPDVHAAGFSSALPLRGEMWGQSFDFEEAPQPEDKQTNANVRFASPEYFQTIGLSLVRGRFCAASDKGQDEVMVSQGFGRRALPGRDLTGMHIRWHIPYTAKTLFFKIVGVVGDARAEPDQNAPPMIYFPYWVWSPNEISLVVRTAADPNATATDVRLSIQRLDSQIAIQREETLHDLVGDAVAPRRFVVSLAVLFAGFATFLAALGLYAVIALSVAQRTQEIGIRMALGARHRDVLRMVLEKGLKISIFGIATGLVCAVPLTQLVSSLLYGVRPTNPTMLLLVCLILAGVTILASYMPARRAARVDPLKALRYE
jgi:putative ABC transport system permease protein